MNSHRASERHTLPLRLRVTEKATVTEFQGMLRLQVINEFLQFGGEAASRHEPELIAGMLSLNDDFVVGTQRFQWDYTQTRDRCDIKWEPEDLQS